MKRKILSMVAAGALVVSMLPVTAFATTTFSDMPNDYSTASLEAAVANGLLSGDDGQIMPEDNLTRAQMATILVRALGYTNVADMSSYSDVNASDWFYTNVGASVYMGLFKGDGASMRPDDSITRQEAFVVLSRAFGLSATDTSVLEQFTDKGSISSWAEAEVAAMVETGYVQGNNGYLNPLSNISRKDFAVVMDRMVETYITESGTYTDVPDGSVVINTPNVDLEGMDIDGSLIIGDGVGDGDISLHGVSADSLVVRGGGMNTVSISGGSSFSSVRVEKAEGHVRLLVDESASLSNVVVSDEKENVVIEGNVSNLEVAANSTVYIRSGDIDEVSITGTNGTVVLEESATVATVTTTAVASNATVVVSSGTSIGAVTTEATNTQVVVEANATVSSVVASETATDTSISVGDGATVASVESAAANTVVDVASGGTVTSVVASETATDTTINVSDGATVASVESAAANTTVDVASGGTVTSVVASETATDTTINVSDGATVESVESAAANTTVDVASGGTVSSATVSGDNATITGSGTVTDVTVSGNDATVDTAGTNVDVSEDATGTVAGDTTVESGTTTTTPSDTSTSTGSSSSSSSSSSKTTFTATDLSFAVTIDGVSTPYAAVSDPSTSTMTSTIDLRSESGSITAGTMTATVNNTANYVSGSSSSSSSFTVGTSYTLAEFITGASSNVATEDSITVAELETLVYNIANFSDGSNAKVTMSVTADDTTNPTYYTVTVTGYLSPTSSSYTGTVAYTLVLICDDPSVPDVRS